MQFKALQNAATFVYYCAFYEMGQSLLQNGIVTVTECAKKHSLKKMKINWPTIFILRKSEKTGRFKNMYFHECVTRELQSLYI